MIWGLVAFGSIRMADVARKVLSAGVAIVVTIGLAGCFTIHVDNPNFPATAREISADLARMERDPVRLRRPVIVLSGYRSPHPVASRLAERICDLTGAERDEVQSLAYIWSGTVEGPARQAVARVEKLWPSDDQDWTSEVDVVAISMGGLVARLAAAYPELRGEPGGKRLKIGTLYTLASPHRGARLADWIRLDSACCSMKPGSEFLVALDEAFASREYEVVPYAVLRDKWVGAKHASPVGQEPIWVPGRLVMSHHLVSFNKRIRADLARRLRREVPLAQPSTPPSE